jgi:predicted AlkP superfamily phosphohydrolase/phosphomutase
MREWMAALCACVMVSVASAGQGARKVIVVGVDGLDPRLLREFLDRGVVPNFGRLIERGEFKPLQTSMPPISPIAWSTFITGMDPGGHGIFDFIHREPQTLKPYLSMSRALQPAEVPPSERPLWSRLLPATLPLGGWEIPLRGGKYQNLRRGRAFWEYLDERGIPTTIFRMPANFPPVATGGRALSGMGTPDITGTSGTFSFYTTRPLPNENDIPGGKVHRVQVIRDRVEAKLFGPDNPVRREEKPTRRRSLDQKPEYRHPKLELGFTVHLDPERPVAKFVVQDDEFILNEGEWSPWVRVDFEAVPLVASVSAIGRFYLKQVRPDFQLYVTPLQVNPEDPAMPISNPEDWSHELFEALGYFYTQELPEDTKAVTGGVFTGQEFWDQSQFVYHEQRAALEHLLREFREGFLFFYFSSVDQGSHMLWHYADPEHPAFVDDAKLRGGIETLYREMDEAVGRVLGAVDDETTLIVMSDHGFCPFYWGVNLNTWLLERGYVTMKDPTERGRGPFFAGVDWSRTEAYALGLNGLYVNVKGRERQGVVSPGAEYEALLDRLERDLLETKDPRNGRSAVTLVVRPRRDFHGPHAADGPDLIVGYNWGYRTSWKSPLGEFPREIFVDNDEAWSGDHCVDARLVPGVLVTNRAITLAEPSLVDLSVAILDEYGIPRPAGMIGKDCLGPRDGR